LARYDREKLWRKVKFDEGERRFLKRVRRRPDREDHQPEERFSATVGLRNQ